MNAIFALVKVFDMQLDDLTYRGVEHEETWALFDGVGWFGDIDHIEYRCQNLIHSLNILNLRVEFGIDVQDTGHVVITICFLLFLLVCNELLIRCFIFPID